MFLVKHNIKRGYFEDLIPQYIYVLRGGQAVLWRVGFIWVRGKTAPYWSASTTSSINLAFPEGVSPKYKPIAYLLGMAWLL